MEYKEVENGNTSVKYKFLRRVLKYSPCVQCLRQNNILLSFKPSSLKAKQEIK